MLYTNEHNLGTSIIKDESDNKRPSISSVKSALRTYHTLCINHKPRKLGNKPNKIVFAPRSNVLRLENEKKQKDKEQTQ